MSERKTSMLQLVAEMQQPDLSICKHCKRIRQQDLRED
jgi:hypothetical protein